ncbi:MAG: AAA family ATPase [Anaerolineales bacterium]|nr:AAA family ATPase [Anaerolineales bacterium]
MIKPNFYILSGAMGGGKSTILSALKARGHHCIPEPAREILAEQRLIQGVGVPEKNPDMFCSLMLSRAMHNYSQNLSTAGNVIFDRSIPDMLVYARLFSLDETPYTHAAHEFRTHPTVFFFPAWQEIYTNDSERKMSFEQARAFGDTVRAIYEKFGYRILEVPRFSIEERVQFILDKLETEH